MSRLEGLEMALFTDAKPTSGGCTVSPDLFSWKSWDKCFVAWTSTWRNLAFFGKTGKITREKQGFKGTTWKNAFNMWWYLKFWIQYFVWGDTIIESSKHAYTQGFCCFATTICDRSMIEIHWIGFKPTYKWGAPLCRGQDQCSNKVTYYCFLLLVILLSITLWLFTIIYCYYYS